LSSTLILHARNVKYAEQLLIGSTTCGPRNHLPYRTWLWTGTERMDKWDAALIARTLREEIIKTALINKRTLRDL